MPPPPGSSSHQSRTGRNNSNTPSPTDNNDNPPSSSRLSKDSEGYPSWLPKRPPPPAPPSTFQSSMLGGHHGHGSSSPSPVEPAPFIGGRKPTPRSVRIVNLKDSVAGAVEKEARLAREGTDQTQVGVHPPPKVWTRASGVPPAAFNASAHDGVLPLPQPRFKAKNLQLQILDSPSKWMRLYYYAWPLLVLYHIPLQTFFDFNAVFILLQVAKFPNPQSSGRGWALGAAAYVASWLAWLLLVCIMYELVYSFSRRWRLRRPLMLPIYLSSPAFNYAAMTSYTNFCFLQHVRFSAFFSSNHVSATPPQSPSDPEYDDDEIYDESLGSWKQGLAETCYFYSQNLATVALLLPRAGLSLALLFSFSSAALVLPFVTSNKFSHRDGTFFRPDGSLTDYARGVLIANAAWTGWRILVLLVSWFGLWIFSNQRLGGLCGPAHPFEESEQEKTRSVYSEAASEYGAYRGSFYQAGEGNEDYGGDELPWEWREATRVRIQDAFELCMTTHRRSSSSAGLRWSGVPVPGYGYALRNRRYRNKHKRWSSVAKGKEPSNEKAEQPFEGLERVLAAAGFASTASPSRRKVLSEDLFDAPPASMAPEHPSIAPLRFEQPAMSANMYTGLEAPKTAKRNSKDKIPGSSTAPYPFSKPGSGHVSSKDSVPFPASGSGAEKLKGKASHSTNSKSSKSKSSSALGSSSSVQTSTGSGSSPGEVDLNDDDEEEEEEDDDDDDLELDDDDIIDDSEEPSSERASGSMSSLGQPISPSRAYLGMHRPVGAGHNRNLSGVSSAVSGGSHVNNQSMSSGGMSLLTQSTGNPESTDSEFGLEGRERASLSQGSPVARTSPLAAGSGAIPMPPRHPHPQGQGRGRSATDPSGRTSSAVRSLSSTQGSPVAFPSVRHRGRVDSGRGGGIMVDPAVLYGESPGSAFSDHELPSPDDEDEEGVLDDVDEEEQHDRVGLLGVPISPRTSLLGGSRISLTNSSSSGDARSRAHSGLSSRSRSRHSSTNARSRSRTHSSQSVRDRASSLGASMRSLVEGAAASLTQLDLVMRGATGPAAGLGGLGIGLGSRPRSRVNSSMARLEEGVEFSPAATEMTIRGREVSGQSSSSGSGSHNGSADVMIPVHPVLGRVRHENELEAEGYSSGGTHSRSGSESLSTENHTFGRPMFFMRPHDVPMQSRVDEEDEIATVDRTNDTTPGRQSPEASQSVPIPIARSVGTSSGDGQPVSESFTSASFYSINPSERTATPPTAVPIQLIAESRDLSPSPPRSADSHSPVRQGVDIIWPGGRRPYRGAESGESESPPMISTAAGSFVTAPATIQGNTTTTESSGGHTIAGSWETGNTANAVRRSGVRSGGMVERPGDDMGLDAGAWRVV
ncbi:hypothetical protein BDN70DRAFT_895487 [Pholiota conissans]|uniref:Proteophosphoglycan ppg4 n=1 Tax=Pholiota conissans TaxID=109636 RepID=A0A9P5Z046_9AGAR|nr:hypothetical protein BDN70DRAFT_895487 [Pholiota conissans]